MPTGEWWQAVGEAGEGLTQGDPESSGFLCVGWVREARDLDTELSNEHWTCVFGNDDGYLLGPQTIVFTALLNFLRRI